MRAKVLGHGAGYGPLGTIEAFFPDQIIEVDDADKAAVAWIRSRAATGFVEVIDGPATKPAHPVQKAENKETGGHK